jgi:hypothetical protein
MIHSIMMLSIMTLSMKGLNVTLSCIPDFKQNYLIRRMDLLEGITTLSITMLSITILRMRCLYETLSSISDIQHVIALPLC